MNQINKQREWDERLGRGGSGGITIPRIYNQSVGRGAVAERGVTLRESIKKYAAWLGQDWEY